MWIDKGRQLLEKAFVGVRDASLVVIGLTLAAGSWCALKARAFSRRRKLERRLRSLSTMRKRGKRGTWLVWIALVWFPLSADAQDGDAHELLVEVRGRFCNDDARTCPELSGASMQHTSYAPASVIVCAAADASMRAMAPVLRALHVAGARSLLALPPLDPSSADPVQRMLDALAQRAEESGHASAAVLHASASLAGACVESSVYDDETNWIDYLEPLAVVTAGEQRALRRIFAAMVGAARQSSRRMRAIEQLAAE